MFQLLRNLDPKTYTFRRYVVSSGDNFSASKAAEFEKELAGLSSITSSPFGSYDIRYVPRARRVHQSLLSTPLTAGNCAWNCVWLLCDKPPGFHAQDAKHTPFPDLILTNGPATATIVIFASIFLRLVGAPGSARMMRCIYVESWARVKRLSLSGQILRTTRACDKFLVQWQSLVQSGLEFRGQLVA